MTVDRKSWWKGVHSRHFRERIKLSWGGGRLRWKKRDGTGRVAEEP